MELFKHILCVSVFWLAIVLLAQAQDGQLIPDTMDIDPSTDLNTLPNNSLYLRWRPRFHVMPAGGHSNDPCGPMYDPMRKVYHIFYQSFPNHVGFGNTSWSHAVSKDLVTWTDVRSWQNRSMVAISVGKYPEYDWIGAFSGGAQAVNLYGEADGNLTLMYTGASRFPDNWQVPYKLMTEQQAIATSSDGGETWQKWSGNPVLNHAPGYWNVTGARDPLFAKLPLMDQALGHEPGSHWYITLGSGIRGEGGPIPHYIGPRIPLFSTPANDLTKWTFLGALFEIPPNVTFGGDVTRTGNYGFNFEMSSIFDLPEEEKNGGDGKTSHWVISAGAEGYSQSFHPVLHWSLYMMGSISRRANGSAEFHIEASGVLDWAGSYALNQFYDPVQKRRVIWGWTDEDLNSTGIKAQGFQGALNIPRELYIMVKHNVIPPKGINIEQAPETWTANGDGTYTVKTVAQRPLPDVVHGLQGGKKPKNLGSMTVSGRQMVEALNSAHYHMQFTVPSVPADGRLSMLLRATPDYAEYVNITYLPSNASIIIDRSHSTLLKNLLKTLFVGTFVPFTTQQSSSSHYMPRGGSGGGGWHPWQTMSTEALVFDIFQDGSMIEVFINDRFAVSSRTYPSRVDSAHFAFEATGPVYIQDIKLWDSMINVWPDRPKNASSPLIFDPYYETHLTFPNPYVDEGYPIYDGYKRAVH